MLSNLCDFDNLLEKFYRLLVFARVVESIATQGHHHAPCHIVVVGDAGTYASCRSSNHLACRHFAVDGTDA